MIELTLHGDDAQVGVAGDTLNTAVYLQRAAPQLQVDYVTRLGDCAFSHRIRDFIAGQGLGTGNVTMDAGRSPGLYAITTDEAGERSFAYWRDTSAARDLFADGDFSMLKDYDAVYLSGITMAIIPHDIRLGFVRWLNGAPVTLIYDSNYRPRLWDSVDHARSVTQAMWARADISLPSIDDEMALFDETADAVTARFARDARNGALKRGASGPLSLGAPVEQTYPAATRVIDTTAAGDSFNGGYLGAWLSGGSQATALMAGHLRAAAVVQRRGAIIAEEDLQSLMRR